MFKQYINPVPKTYYGRRSLDILREIKPENLVMVHSKTLEGNEEFGKICSLLKEKKVTFIVPEKNTFELINETAKTLPKNTLIIGIGGGNIMDFSKLLRLKVDNPDVDLTKVINSDNLNKKTELILIPSTPSTGSQVTPIAITHDKENRKKIIIINEYNIPNLAVLSPQILTTISENQMAEFLCDIFAHSVESYLSRLTSSFIQNLAEMNLKTLIDNWKKYKETKNNLAVLERISINGQVGGICQGNAYVGVMHALAHQLEIMAGISHSRALMHLIRPVLEWYKEKIGQEIYGRFIEYFDELNLGDYQKKGVFENIDKEELILSTLNDPSIKTSPIIFDEEKVRNLVKWILTKK